MHIMAESRILLMEHKYPPPLIFDYCLFFVFMLILFLSYALSTSFLVEKWFIQNMKIAYSELVEDFLFGQIL